MWDLPPNLVGVCNLRQLQLTPSHLVLRVRDQGVGGSNPLSPTIFSQRTITKLRRWNSAHPAKTALGGTPTLFHLRSVLPCRRERWPRVTIVERKSLINDQSLPVWNRRQVHQVFVIQYLQMQPRLTDVT